jgi:uncharacterized protein involved in exopolysaccharide biosynthesis
MDEQDSRKTEAPAFDALEYVLHLRRRWAFIAVACFVALAAAVIVSLLMPSRFTSTASILIEPPAGTDPRTFTAISPIYLESLRTYETFASSGALFQRALDKFQLRDTARGSSIESIKAKVLKVSKLRDTKVLQISVTLENPRQAQAMAQYMAEETVKLISSISRNSGQELASDQQRQLDAARTKLEATQAAMAKVMSQYPAETMKTELESMIDLLYRLKRELYESEAFAAEYASPGIKTKVQQLTSRVKELDQAVAAKTKLLAEASSRNQSLEMERRTALASYESALRRAQDLQSWAGASGERLQIIDPGTVPERPTEPRPLLYAGVAVALAFLGSIVFLSIQYGLRS